jgi:gluconate 5-dehydrogenase
MTRNLFDLTGEIALITGGTRGLGMAMARGLAEAGARIVINGHNPEGLEQALSEYVNSGIEAKGYLCDVTNEPRVKDMIGAIEREVGVITILINNAGMIRRIPLADMAVEEFRQVVDLDLVAPFIMARAVVKGMIERRKGKIINICSMMSELGRDTVGAYAAAKGGLKMLTRSMATEWGPYNIQVNGIGPGYFATPQTAPIRENGHPMNDFIISRTPAGRWGDPEELAGPAVFLASRASDYVNGHILYVDGGMLATLGKPIHEMQPKNPNT